MSLGGLVGHEIEDVLFAYFIYGVIEFTSLLTPELFWCVFESILIGELNLPVAIRGPWCVPGIVYG